MSANAKLTEGNIWTKAGKWFFLIVAATAFGAITIWSFWLNIIVPTVMGAMGFLLALSVGVIVILGSREEVEWRGWFDMISGLLVCFVMSLYLLLEVALPWYHRDILITQLQSVDPTKRVEALEKLGRTLWRGIFDGPGTRLQAITTVVVASVDDKDVRVRQRAVALLDDIDIVAPDVTKALITALGDSDGDVRAEAARIVGANKVTMARKSLTIVAIRDTYPKAREKAAWALGKLKLEQPASHNETPATKRGVRGVEVGWTIGSFIGILVGSYVLFRIHWFLGVTSLIGAIAALISGKL